ncbi:MAG: shikimate kinase, partial [Polyangiaceae bacterium]
PGPKPSVPDNIFLCGLSGSGKSTVAPILASLRGCEALDTDAMVASEAGLTIAEIFAREGEIGFRDREARAVAAACARQHAIVALGGGALERDESFVRIGTHGLLVFLDAPDRVLTSRLRADGNEIRPLLARPNALSHLRARRLVRFQTAAMTIDTSMLSPPEVAERINNVIPSVAR